MESAKDLQTKTEDRLDWLKLKITSVAGFLLPLLASIPPFGFWGGLMTIPFILYLMLMFENIGNIVLIPFDIFNTVVYSIGIILLLYSIAYLRKNKSTGLVTSGPYSIVRHPQYFSLIIFTGIMTYQSAWLLSHTLGIGWLSVDETILLWTAMLVAYALIASIEELHLKKVYESKWTEYRKNVGFLLPFANFQSHIVEAAICVIIPIIALYLTLLITG